MVLEKELLSPLQPPKGNGKSEGWAPSPVAHKFFNLAGISTSKDVEDL
jgi:hypothetical protein